MFSFKPKKTKLLKSKSPVRFSENVVKEFLLIVSRVKFFMNMLRVVIFPSMVAFFLKKCILSFTQMMISIVKTSKCAPKFDGNDQSLAHGRVPEHM